MENFSRYKWILLAITIAFTYWLLESLVDTLFFFEASFLTELLNPGTHEIWMRLIIVILLMGFGLFAQYTINCKVKAGSLLKELFHNLVENSIQHSRGNKIKINSKEKNNNCIITIEDDGKGIPDKDKDKVFEKGFKDEETGGTGLGLHIAKKNNKKLWRKNRG